MSSYQGSANGSASWNGWDDAPPKQQEQPAKARAANNKGWAGWDAGDELPDEVWDADWGK